MQEGEARPSTKSAGKKPGHGGVGRGRMRFYADSEGNIRGAAISLGPSKFHGQDDCNNVIGRPLAKAD